MKFRVREAGGFRCYLKTPSLRSCSCIAVSSGGQDSLQVQALAGPGPDSEGPASQTIIDMVFRPYNSLIVDKQQY